MVYYIRQDNVGGKNTLKILEEYIAETNYILFISNANIQLHEFYIIAKLIYYSFYCKLWHPTILQVKRKKQGRKRDHFLHEKILISFKSSVFNKQGRKKEAGSRTVLQRVVIYIECTLFQVSQS